MKRRGSGLLVVGLVLVGSLLACAAPQPGPGPTPESSLPPPAEPTATASPTSPKSPTASPTPALAERCARLVDRLDLAEQVGQLFMAAISSEGARAADRRALRRSAVGSVILLGNTTSGVDAVARVTEEARRAAGKPGGVPALLAADQEGGQVQRLRGDGFSRIPSAIEQAEEADAALSRNAARWGEQLREAGIDANLAPVADVVPEDLRDVNEPIGRLDRGYGSDPETVARKVTAFIDGMDEAGVATAVKHFPGLGRVRGNTDFEADVVDRQTRRGGPDLAGFKAAVGAGVDMVMIASASYRQIDREHRAAYSPVVIGMIRSDLGFGGVIISDDLAARAFEDVPTAERALRYFRAGGDLAIVGDIAQLAEMARSVVDAASEDADFAAEVAAKATRILTLKAHRGLLDC